MKLWRDLQQLEESQHRQRWKSRNLAVCLLALPIFAIAIALVAPSFPRHQLQLHSSPSVALRRDPAAFVGSHRAPSWYRPTGRRSGLRPRFRPLFVRVFLAGYMVTIKTVPMFTDGVFKMQSREDKFKKWNVITLVRYYIQFST